MTDFWNTVLYPVLGEVVPWLVVIGVPLTLYWYADKHQWTWRDRRRKW